MDWCIRVQGHPDPTFQHRFAGWRLEQEEDGTTVLSGSLPDQAVLQGVLLQIVRMELTLRELSTREAEDS